eukprot:CAMPEP_0117587190 /NCGR_PEP_ID=MMETSP0784-20121206/69146_1 /TAXON_ID=39447 /ORGANISM="" /LENGTH=48 /DNA_ID= /DNA_START= /DNA_END= /DNA_ORIENTATION=
MTRPLIIKLGFAMLRPPILVAAVATDGDDADSMVMEWLWASGVTHAAQ